MSKEGILKKIFSIAIIPIIINLIQKIYLPVKEFVYDPTIATTKNIFFTLAMFIFNSQQLIFESSKYIMENTLSTWELIGSLWSIIGYSLVSILLVSLLYRMLMWFRGDTTIDRLTSLVIIITVIFAVGFIGTFANYIANGIFVIPYHGFLEIGNLFKYFIGIN